MSKIKPALGRGLDALINPQTRDDISQPITVPANQMKQDDGVSENFLAKIPTSKILPNPYQPRTEFSPKALDELKESIAANGLIQPITIRRTSDNSMYELISGERRLRACLELGYTEIPAYIIKVDTKEAMLALALIENIQREKLNPIEIGIAYQRLIEECNLSQEEVANKVGKDRSTITNTIRLLKLEEEVKKRLISEEISQGHARALLSLSDKKSQLDILGKIIKDQLSVRKTERLVKNFVEQKNKKTQPDNQPSKNIQNLSQSDLEDKLRVIFGTKVVFNQRKDGSGEVVFEYYSNDELERLFDLFSMVGKTAQ